MGKEDGLLKGVGLSRAAALGYARRFLPRKGDRAWSRGGTSSGRHVTAYTLTTVVEGRHNETRDKLRRASAGAAPERQEKFERWPSPSLRQRYRLTWLPPQVKLHRLYQAAVAPSPHRQARAWPKSTRSCPRAERVHHRCRRRTPRRRRSTCKLSRRGWCTREDTERSTSLSSLLPSPRSSGSSTHGRITVAGPHTPACLSTQPTDA